MVDPNAPEQPLGFFSTEELRAFELEEVPPAGNLGRQCPSLGGGSTVLGKPGKGRGRSPPGRVAAVSFSLMDLTLGDLT